MRLTAVAARRDRLCAAWCISCDWNRLVMPDRQPSASVYGAGLGLGPAAVLRQVPGPSTESQGPPGARAPRGDASLAAAQAWREMQGSLPLTSLAQNRIPLPSLCSFLLFPALGH